MTKPASERVPRCHPPRRESAVLLARERLPRPTGSAARGCATTRTPAKIRRPGADPTQARLPTRHPGPPPRKKANRRRHPNFPHLLRGRSARVLHQDPSRRGRMVSEMLAMHLGRRHGSPGCVRRDKMSALTLATPALCSPNSSRNSASPMTKASSLAMMPGPWPGVFKCMQSVSDSTVSALPSRIAPRGRPTSSRRPA